jgi:sugar lactone lactonase YvrE
MPSLGLALLTAVGGMLAPTGFAVPLEAVKLASQAAPKIEAGTIQAVPVPSRGELVLLQSNWTWNENIAFGGGALWLSDAMTGELRRMTRNPAGNYSTTVHFKPGSPFAGMAGLFSDPSDATILYAAAHFSNETSVIITTGTAVSSAGSYDILAVLPSAVKGNGLRGFNGKLYVSAEGDFLPGNGWLFSVDQKTGELTQLSDGQLWAADGLWISSQGSLFVGELFALKLWQQDLSNPTNNNGSFIQGPSRGGWLDDFTLDESNQLFSGANFYLGRIDQWYLNGTMVDTPLVTNLTTPTSCRWGSEADGFPSTSLFISEGGGIFSSFQNTRRTWELRNARD